MKSDKAPRLPERLHRTFDRYRRRWRVVGTLRGLLLSAAILIGAVALALAADRLLRLPAVPRAIFLLAILGTFAFFFVRWVLVRLLRRMHYRQVAIGLGRRFPRMEEDLVSAVELSGLADGRQGVSRSLVRSALEKIESRTETVDPRPAVPLRSLVQGAVVFVALAGLLAAGHLLRPEAFENALVRLLRPDRAVPYFCYTKLSVAPGDKVIAAGDKAEVVAKVSGRRPDEARLEAVNGGQMLSVKLPCAGGAARWRSAALFEDLNYRVLAGDAISEWHRIRVVPPPAVGAKGARLRDPEYAGAAERTIEKIEGTLEIVAGTAVAIRAVPIDRGPEEGFRCRAELRYGQRTLPFKPDASGALWSAFFTPAGSTRCAIHLTDAFGLTNRSPQDVAIRVVPDRLPQVTVLSPRRDVLALPGETIRLDVSAADEFGLRRLDLTYRAFKGAREEEKPRRWEVRKLKAGGVKVRKLRAQTQLVLDEMALVPGDVLEYRARASDYADQAAFRQGHSRTFRVTVLSEAEHLEAVLGRLRQLQVELLAKAADQEQKAAHAGELAEQARHSSVSQEAAKAQQAEAELSRSTEELAGEIESLIPELARNPSSPLSMMTGLEGLARGVRSVAAQPMGDMGKSLAAAAASEQPAQTPQLSKAQELGKTAAEQLKQLARLAERLQRQGILEKLANEADLLAARQRELKSVTAPLARKTMGLRPDQLSEDLKRSLSRLAAGEESIKSGTDSLAEGINDAVGSLSYSNPQAAATAEQAGKKLQSDKVSGRARKLAGQMKKNILFSGLNEQESVARSLAEVARILRDSAQTDPLEQIVAKLEEFIARQRGVNRQIKAAIGKGDDAEAGPKTGAAQGELEREVSEHASALSWLALEVAGFESATAQKLQAASGEMRAGAEALYKPKLPEGLRHGEKALEHLLSARKKLRAEMQQMAQACGAQQSMEALLLLQRIVLGQKKVNKNTLVVDKARGRLSEGLDERLARLARNQNAVRHDTARLERMLGRYPGAAAIVAKAGGKMGLSLSGLEAGDTGRGTRAAQIQALLLLEKLLDRQCKAAQGSCGGLAMMRLRAMMRMMGMAGPGGGGFAGGLNAPLLPTSVDRAGEDDWRKVRSRFDEQLGAEIDSKYPVEFRSLLNAYFDRLRKQPPR